MAGSHPESSDEAAPAPRWRRALLWSLGAVAAVAIGIQLVPYGWWHENPPVAQAAPWPDAESEAIARESCYACHSNETDWPAYSYVAPMSWLVRYDVESGRDELNFSDWARFADEADDAAEAVLDGEMPLGRYTVVHRDAQLTEAERDVLVTALAQMAGDGGGDDSGRGRGRGGGEG
jgi:hypothetical protein